MFKPKLEMKTWVNIQLSFLPPSGVCGKPVSSASTVLGVGGAMARKTDTVALLKDLSAPRQTIKQSR